MYAKYTRIFRTPKETSKSHQNSDFLGFRGPRGILCTRGEKEHTSKRVSVIVPDNAISKTKCATRTRLRTNLSRTPKIHQNSDFLGILGTPRDTVYPWGKGVCKHKTGDCRLRRLTGQKRSIRRISRKGNLIKAMIRCFCLSAKAMRLWRDVRLWHVVD